MTRELLDGELENWLHQHRERWPLWTGCDRSWLWLDEPITEMLRWSRHAALWATEGSPLFAGDAAGAFRLAVIDRAMLPPAHREKGLDHSVACEPITVSWWANALSMHGAAMIAEARAYVAHTTARMASTEHWDRDPARFGTGWGYGLGLIPSRRHGRCLTVSNRALGMLAIEARSLVEEIMCLRRPDWIEPIVRSIAKAEGFNPRIRELVKREGIKIGRGRTLALSILYPFLRPNELDWIEKAPRRKPAANAAHLIHQRLETAATVGYLTKRIQRAIRGQVCDQSAT